jgi:hypothetical protein
MLGMGFADIVGSSLSWHEQVERQTQRAAFVIFNYNMKIIASQGSNSVCLGIVQSQFQTGDIRTEAMAPSGWAA